MTKQTDFTSGPHQGQPIRVSGQAIQHARGAMVVVHGRGAQAEDILSLSDQFAVGDIAYLAPQASGNTWYPNRFLAPIDSNEPWLSSALAFIEEALTQIRTSGIPFERTMLLGFSQGACLTLEFAARHAHFYGGVVGLSGALIGPEDMPRKYSGSLAGTPVFLGCSDVDFHVPKEQVQRTADVLRGLGGEVTMRLYPNLDHSVNQDEIDCVRGMLLKVLASS
jgi:predicted esterase